MPEMIDMESTGLRISSGLANKHKQKHGLFSGFSLAVIIACEADKKPQIFLTISNQKVN